MMRLFSELQRLLSRLQQKNYEENIDFDYVFTICDNAKEICPIYPHAKQMIHHSFMDPADATGTEDEQLKVYIKVRDQLRDYFKSFAENKLS